MKALLSTNLLGIVIVLGMMFGLPARGDMISFDFGGTVTKTELGWLFPGKSPGDSFSGSFTVDTEASLLVTSLGYAVYNGSTFDVTIEGTSYGVGDFRVWNGSSSDDGVEFSLPGSGLVSGYLSLRSGSEILATTAVPTIYDIANFDTFFNLSAEDSLKTYPPRDEGSITSITPQAVPTPSAFLLGFIGLGVAGRKLRRRRTA